MMRNAAHGADSRRGLTVVSCSCVIGTPQHARNCSSPTEQAGFSIKATHHLLAVHLRGLFACESVLTV